MMPMTRFPASSCPPLVKNLNGCEEFHQRDLVLPREPQITQALRYLNAEGGGRLPPPGEEDRSGLVQDLRLLLCGPRTVGEEDRISWALSSV